MQDICGLSRRRPGLMGLSRHIRDGGRAESGGRSGSQGSIRLHRDRSGGEGEGEKGDEE